MTHSIRRFLVTVAAFALLAVVLAPAGFAGEDDDEDDDKDDDDDDECSVRHRVADFARRRSTH